MAINYNFKTNIPQYIPSDTPPRGGLSDCLNRDKTSELLAKIDNSNVTDEEKIFLKRAATRHYVFNYSKIADYYATASAEMQELMEDSALVIIDIDDAIAKGYVKLNKAFQDILNERTDDNVEE